MVPTIMLALGAIAIGGETAPEHNEPRPTISIETRLIAYEPHADDPSAAVEIWTPERRIDRPQGNATSPAVAIGDELSVVYTGKGHVNPITAPMLVTYPDEPATLAIGEVVTYSELTGEGDAMRLVVEEPLQEGVEFSTRATIAGDDSVRFEAFTFTLCTLVGRLDIGTPDGSRTEPIPGGRPIVRRVSYSLPITIPKGQEAIVLLSPASEHDTTYVLRVRATVER